LDRGRDAQIVAAYIDHRRGVCVQTALFAQGVIGGVVRDKSGGVLPGVTVEAASPALIER
jgi:hypothetical protein